MKCKSAGIINLLVLSIVLQGCGNQGKNSNTVNIDDHSFLTMNSQKPDLTKAALINIELGLSYLQMQQVPRAKAKLVHATKLAPQLPEVHSAMAYFLEQTSELKDAEKEHFKAINLSKETGGVYNNYGAFLCRNNRFKEADKAFQKALSDKNYARTSEIYENAGMCALKWPDEQKAEYYFHTALQRDPAAVGAIMALADLAMQKGQWAAVQQLLEQYKTFAAPSARSLWMDIQLARVNKDVNKEASLGLKLKTKFKDSNEYKQYIQK